MFTVTAATFEEDVLKAGKPVLADFNSSWCGPCQKLKPVLEELSAERPDVKFVSIDTDDEDELAEEYKVETIPCIVLFKGGAEVRRSIGFIDKSAVSSFLDA